jgi:hypothetical protein
LVPRRRARPGSASSAATPAVQASHRTPPDLADRCLGADSLGRRHSGLLAPGRRRGQRRRPGDGDFPPEPTGARSSPEPPRRSCGTCSPAGDCPSN